MLMLNSRELQEDVIADLKLDQNPNFLAGDSNGFLSRLLIALTGKKGDEDEASEADDLAGQPPYDEPARSPEESARLARYVTALEEELIVEPLRDTRASQRAGRETRSADCRVCGYRGNWERLLQECLT